MITEGDTIAFDLDSAQWKGLSESSLSGTEIALKSHKKSSRVKTWPAYASTTAISWIGIKDEILGEVMVEYTLS